MSVRIVLSVPLDEYVGRFVEVDASGDVGKIIDTICRLVPELRVALKDEKGKLYPHVNVYLNGEDIRHLKGVKTKAQNGDEILIVPAIAGG